MHDAVAKVMTEALSVADNWPACNAFKKMLATSVIIWLEELVIHGCTCITSCVVNPPL